MFSLIVTSGGGGKGAIGGSRLVGTCSGSRCPSQSVVSARSLGVWEPRSARLFPAKHSFRGGGAEENKRRRKKEEKNKTVAVPGMHVRIVAACNRVSFATTSSSFHLISVTDSASTCFAWSTLSSPLSPSFPSADYKSQAGRTRALHVRPVRSRRHRRNGRPPIDLTSVETPGQT